MGVKRAVDVVVGTVLAVAALPLIVVLLVCSAVAFRAWPIFVQDRVGRSGRVFRFPKVRTLPPETASATDKYALSQVRIPAFGRLLRRTHLDELPQLLLVPVGVMSLVGPRPEMPDVLARYPTDFVRERTSVRPGCTCLWQISESADKLIYEAPEYDRAYLRHANPLLDAWILYRTARAWLPKASAIELSDLPTWACRPSYRSRDLFEPAGPAVRQAARTPVGTSAYD
jgi:lipopolysaccharide/colanic/teichoic acid biosynthesis glycosyltransferase